MNLLLISQVIGLVAALLLYVIQFWIAINPKSTSAILRIAIIWTSIYVFFLFILRLFSFFGVGTQEQLRIISGVTTLVPLIMLLINIAAERKVRKETQQEVKEKFKHEP